MDVATKKKHTAPEARRKERISADTGHRKDIKKGGAGGKAVLGREVRAPRAPCDLPAPGGWRRHRAQTARSRACATGRRVALWPRQD